MVLEGANTVSPSVLDRLNALLEDGGVLTVDERGHLPDGQHYTLTPHPGFRYDSYYSEHIGHIAALALAGAWSEPKG